MTVKIKKVERVCIHNVNCRKSGDNRSILYDHEVWDDGVLVAQFEQLGPRKRNFRLVTPDRIEICRPAGYGGINHGVRATSASEFIPLYLDLKNDRRIPSSAQVGARKAAEAERKAKEEANRLEQVRLDRIKEAGPALLQALQDMLVSMRLKHVKIPVYIEQQAEKAIELATKEPQ